MSVEQDFWNPKRHAEHDARMASPPPRGLAARGPSFVERIVDRMHDLRSDARVGVAALIAVAVVAGIVWYRIGTGSGEGAGAAAKTVSASRPPDSRAATTTTGASVSTSSDRIAVHVAGAVARPGVVELPAGSRVIDAVEAVGGVPAEADLDRLNLAAKLVDGERVFVPKLGQADPGVIGDAAVGERSGGSQEPPTPGTKLNLNTASQAQLEALPGIGPAYAQAIIAERERRGGFKSVNELRSVRGIGDKRFAQIAPLVTV